MLDVDGVLVTGRSEDGEFWAEDIERDIGVSVNDLRRHLFVPYWAEIVEGRLDLRAVLSKCLPLFAPHLTVGELMAYWFGKDARIDEKVLADMRRLRAEGVAIYLATNQEHYRARHLMDHLGLGRHVDGMVHSAALGVRKPRTAFFETAASRVGLIPSHIMLIDDTAANVEGARSAGWRAKHWTSDQSLFDLVTEA